MRVLIVTRLFPNSVEPLWAPYNRLQFLALSKQCEVEILAVIPWFPAAGMFARWSKAGQLSSVPRHEIVDGVDVGHPRYLHLPRLPGLSASLYAASLAGEVLRRRKRFDVLLSAWAYPDGVGTVALGRLLGLPAVVKVHGSDINVISAMPGPRRNLRWAMPRANRVVAVSRQLAERVSALGAPADRIDVIANGVDGELFFPRDRAEARAAVGHGADRRRWLVYMGRIEKTKGIVELMAAFERLSARRDDVRLVLVGDGAATMPGFQELAGRLGDRVFVAGGRPHGEVPLWLGAADVLVLPSWAEGTPNVVIEALACGRRVVATRVGGIPDLITRDELGELVPARDDAALEGALDRAASVDYDGAAIARAGSRGGWDESARKLHGSLRAAMS